jgi:predicted nucleic acid-binding protein
MPVKVVDASAMGALVFGEPEAEEVALQLENHILAAPSLLWFDLASICLKKIRTSPHQKDRLLEAFQLSHSLPVRILTVDYLKVISLAEDKQVTTYDASYLLLSQQLKSELVTLDRQLLSAAAT